MAGQNAFDESALATLRDPRTIRQRCHHVLDAGLRGELDHFRVDVDRLSHAADLVANETRERYSELEVPHHSRWSHFRAGGVDRVKDFAERLSGRTRSARAAARFELVVISVLLDAGAGPDWRYEREGQTYRRSEGLAVASYHMFVDGLFSSDADDPLRADKDALARFDVDRLREGFQVSGDNPLVGLEGRAELIARLAMAIEQQPDLFGRQSPRIGGLFRFLTQDSAREDVPAPEILGAVLDGFSPIWPARESLPDRRLGDVWPHPHAGGDGPTAGWVPFHKLSQWLAYSMIEPIEWAGLGVTEIEALTGLAEYRNGGLFVDAEVLVPLNPSITQEIHHPQDPLIVEWRALTVALLDRLAPAVRERLGVDEDEFPLTKVLEGGSWHTGRRLAAERRADGSPPIRVQSDGTLF